MYMSEDYRDCYTGPSCRYESGPVKLTGDCMHVRNGVAMPYPSPPAMPMMTSRRFRLTEDMSRYQRELHSPSPPLGYRVHPHAVARRNERERNRVKHINSTFSTLRQHLPSGGKSRKLSKVETLRSAVRYIQHLQTILTAQEDKRTGVADEQSEDNGKGKGPPLAVPEKSPKSPTSSELSDCDKDLVTSPTGSTSSTASSRLSEGRAEPLSPPGMGSCFRGPPSADLPSSSPAPSEDSCSTLSGSFDTGSSAPTDGFSDLNEWFI